MTDLRKWAGHLFDAEARAVAVAPITDTEPSLTLEQAYEIQAETLALRRARGERVVGAKLGLTSRAKQEQIGITEPIYAWLTDAMALPLEAPLALGGLVHPRAEPEIVFVLGDRLEGPGITAADVLDATGGLCCGLEVIDSRYVDFRFTLPDVVADNASSARFVLGPARVRPDFDCSLVGCLLDVDGECVATAAGAAALGHPAEAVALLANTLGHRGLALERGWVVLSGGLTDAVPLTDGTNVDATFGRLGRVGLRAVA